jgi:hypothetical protein
LSGALTALSLEAGTSACGKDAGSSTFPPAVGDGNPGLGAETCFIEKFVNGLRMVATLGRDAGLTGFLGGDEGGGDLREVENFEEGIGEEGGFGIAFWLWLWLWL